MAGRGACAGRHRARLAIQHHLFVGHHRRAEGHRPPAFDALVAHPALDPHRLRPRCGHADLDAALLEHDAGQLHPDDRARRHRDPDVEIRRARVSGARAEISGDALDARPGSVSALDGVSRVRSLRPVVVSGEDRDKRAISGGAEGRGRPSLAGSPRGFIRIDRRRRYLPARLHRASGQAAYGRQACARTRYSLDRRSR